MVTHSDELGDVPRALSHKELLCELFCKPAGASDRCITFVESAESEKGEEADEDQLFYASLFYGCWVLKKCTLH